MIGVPDWRYSRGEGAVKINRLHYAASTPPQGPSRPPCSPRGGSKTLMARDPIKLTIQGDDDDGLRVERWLAEILTLCGGGSHPELVRLMMERIERREEIRARNLGVRVTRNNVTEPTPGTIAHRVWDIISRLRKPDGSVDRHNVLNAAVFERRCSLNAALEGRDQSGHSNGTVEPMEQVSWHDRFHGIMTGFMA